MATSITCKEINRNKKLFEFYFGIGLLDAKVTGKLQKSGENLKSIYKKTCPNREYGDSFVIESPYSLSLIWKSFYSSLCSTLKIRLVVKYNITPDASPAKASTR